MAYNIRNVIDVANKLQGMPPDRKTFGYGLGLVKGTPIAGQPLVMGPYTSTEEVAEVFGSNSEAVKQANIYFQGGWFGKPFQFFVCQIDTETLASLPEWTAAQYYQVDTKVQDNGQGYICTVAHTSSGEFSTDLWTLSAEELPDASEWESGTEYDVGAEVKVPQEENPSKFNYYTCNYAHTSPDEFTTTCWAAFVPSGQPVEEWMTSILQSSQNYYVILPSVEFSTPECVAIASAVESAAQPKQAIFMYSGTDAYDPTATEDLGAQLQALSYDRSMVIYDAPDALGNVQYVSSAVLSAYATVSFTSARPSITMADKPLNGVKALDLKSPVYSALQGKNYNFYTKTTDIDTNMFIDTRMASGQFFDTIQAADWLAYDMKYKLVNLVQTRDKVPFTEDGLSIIKQTISETCVEALNAGIIGTGYDNDGNLIENGYLISIPSLGSISKADKAKRILRDVKVTFLLAGAVQVINVLNDIQL